MVKITFRTLIRLKIGVGVGRQTTRIGRVVFSISMRRAEGIVAREGALGGLLFRIRVI
jgi:hypothetical protein